MFFASSFVLLLIRVSRKTIADRCLSTQHDSFPSSSGADSYVAWFETCGGCFGCRGRDMFACDSSTAGDLSNAGTTPVLVAKAPTVHMAAF